MSRKNWAIQASATPAIRARLNLLAIEWQIPRSETREVLRSGKAMIEFSRRHRVSLDWLIRGDLKGLHRMTVWSREMAAAGVSGY